MEKVFTTSQYVELISSLDELCETDHPLKTEVLLFRGQADTDYELLPSIARGRRYAADYTIFNDERNMIEMAKYKLPDVFRKDLEPLELLALLQHHGIPTRLLDITENALVALYFACCSAPEKDGEVFVFKENERDVTTYPVVQAIADSYRFAKGTFYQLELFYANVISQPYFLEQKLMNEICHQDNKVGGRWIEECCIEPFFVYAPTRSLRQQLQRGRFILFPNEIKHYNESPDGSFVANILPLPKDHKCIEKRICIPAESKHKILKELSLLGISRETLFADSIDTVCDEIRGYYSK